MFRRSLDGSEEWVGSGRLYCRTMVICGLVLQKRRRLDQLQPHSVESHLARRLAIERLFDHLAVLGGDSDSRRFLLRCVHLGETCSLRAASPSPAGLVPSQSPSLGILPGPRNQPRFSPHCQSHLLENTGVESHHSPHHAQLHRLSRERRPFRRQLQSGGNGTGDLSVSRMV